MNTLPRVTYTPKKSFSEPSVTVYNAFLGPACNFQIGLQFICSLDKNILMTVCGTNPPCHPGAPKCLSPPQSGDVIGVKLQPRLHFDLHPEASGNSALECCRRTRSW